MTASDRTEVLRRAWKEVAATFAEGSYCAECEHCQRSGPAPDEPASRECRVQFVGDDPRDCPSVDMDAIAADVAAGAEEAASARREFFSEAAILRSLGYGVSFGGRQ